MSSNQGAVDSQSAEGPGRADRPGSPGDRHGARVVVVVPMKEEFRELFAFIKEQVRQDIDDKTRRYDYVFRRGDYECIATCLGDWSETQAATATVALIEKWNPDAVVLLGIAAALHDDLKLGDVVVATQIVGYIESGKAEASDDPQAFLLMPGVRSFDCSPDLVKHVLNLEFAYRDAFQKWKEACSRDRDALNVAPSCCEAIIASGPVVSASVAFARWVRGHNRNIKALEMEAAGVMSAVRDRVDQARSLVVRGISDFGDERKNSLETETKGAVRCWAARNAIRMLWAILDLGLIPPRGALAATERKRLEESIRTVLAGPSHELEPGDTVGPYRLLQAIGEGAFARVWLAHDNRADTRAAVKVFRPLGFPESERHDAAVRFHEGAAAMRKLNAPARIVQLHEGPSISEGHLWFAMEFLEDGDLSKALQANRLNTADKLQVVADLIEAVSIAHAGGVRHRDLRPQNVLLKRDAHVVRAVLADFDIAYYDHVLRSRESTVSPLGVVRYTPPEIFGASPEDMKDLLRQYSNDLYALAVVVFDMFAGKPSLPAERSPKRLEELLRRSADVDARTRRHIATFCAGGLGTSQEQRYRTIDEARSAWGATRYGSVRRSVPWVVAAALAGLVLFGTWIMWRSGTGIPANPQPKASISGAVPLNGVESGTSFGRVGIPDAVVLEGDASMDAPGTPECRLPKFVQGASRRYLATSDTETGADYLHKKVATLAALQPGGAAWNTSLSHYEKTCRGRKKWLLIADSMSPEGATRFCDWLVRCQGWRDGCTVDSPCP